MLIPASLQRTLSSTSHIKDMLILLMVHDPLLLLLGLLSHSHVAHGGQECQLLTTAVADELAVGVLGALGLTELDLRQLGLRPVIAALMLV